MAERKNNEPLTRGLAIGGATNFHYSIKSYNKIDVNNRQQLNHQLKTFLNSIYIACITPIDA